MNCIKHKKKLVYKDRSKPKVEVLLDLFLPYQTIGKAQSDQDKCYQTSAELSNIINPIVNQTS